MPHPLTLSTAGAIALVGIFTGVQLGRSAIAEIDPIYYSERPTRFHADLVPNPPSDSPPNITLAQADQNAALGTGCVGCRTYPEEYYPIHDASIDRYSSGYARDADAAPALAVLETEEPDPEAIRLRDDMERVERYARGGEPQAVYASAEAEPAAEVQREEVPAND